MAARKGFIRLAFLLSLTVVAQGPSSRKAMTSTARQTLLTVAALGLASGAMHPASPDRIRFEHLPGISQSTVTGIVQDSHGYIWIATHDGLNRYDGYAMTIFRHEPSDSTGLRGTWIAALGCTPSGRLWVAYGIGGLSLYRAAYHDFQHLSATLAAPLRLSSDLISTVHEASDGSLWVGTLSGGVNRILFRKHNNGPPAPDRVEVHRHNPARVHTLPADSILDIEESPDGILWIATRGGVRRFSPETSRFEPPGLFPPPGLVQSLYRSPGGELWALSESSLLRYEQADSSFRPVSLPGASAPVSILGDTMGTVWVSTAGGEVVWIQRPSSSPQRQIRHLALAGLPAGQALSLKLLDRQGMIWALTSTGRLIRIDPATLAARELTLPVTRREAQRAVSVILEDRSGTIWVGTTRSGLWQFNRFREKFRSVLYTGDPDGLPDGNVTALAQCAGSASRVWVGTSGKGLRVYDLVQHRFLSPRELPRSAREFSASSITALQTLGDTLCVGTQSDGLFMLSGTHTRSFVTAAEDPQTISGGPILAIYPDPPSSLWLGIGGGGLNRVGLTRGSVVRYPFTDPSVASLASPSLWSILRDSKGHFWFGLAAGGLQTGLPGDDGTFTRLQTFPVTLRQRCSLNNRTVTAMHEARDGSLWFGTYSGGLNLLRDSCFTHLTTHDGLPGNLINGILEDDSGRLWLSTNAGIARYEPSSGQIRAFDTRDGLQGTEFNRGACLRHSDGTMLFGGVAGFNVFHPDSLQENTVPPPVVISRFVVNNVEYSSPVPVEDLRTVVLSHDRNSLAFEFVALDFTNPENNLYATQLEGWEDRWTNADMRRYVQYTNLSPGEYRFQVRAANSDGVWNHTGVSISITITPPLWSTWYFRAIAAAGLLALLWLGYTAQVRYRIGRALRLESLRIQEAERVRAQTARDFHDEMGHRLTRITMLSETASRQLAAGSADGDLRKSLETISENARSLYQGTRDFLWALDPHHDTLFDMVLRLRDFGEEIFEGTGITFEARGFEPDLSAIRLSMGIRRNLQLVFKEALHNVLKHARCTTALLNVARERETYSITVSDDGQGFDRSTTPAGHGLRNIRTRVEQIGGNLEIGTGPSGTTVRYVGKIPRSGGLPLS